MPSIGAFDQINSTTLRARLNPGKAATLLIVSVVLTLTTACAMPWNRPVQGRATLGDWQFEYTVAAPEGGNRSVLYEYPRNTAADVEAAAAALNLRATHLAQSGKPFQVTVVFRRPIPIEEFMTFARTTAIMPTGSLVRTHDGIMGVPPEFASDGRGRSLIGQPKPGGKPIDTDGLARWTGGHHGSIIGVISTDTILDATTYEKVRRDPRVYALDVMRQVLTDEIQRRHPGMWGSKLQIRSSLLYGSMEETHIAPAVK